jgi:hypothetical protein
MADAVTRELYLTAITGPFVPGRSSSIQLPTGATTVLSENGARNPLSVRLSGVAPAGFDIVFSRSPDPSDQSLRLFSAGLSQIAQNFVLLENEQLYIRNLGVQALTLAINEAYL